MTIAKNKVVSFDYTLRDMDDEVMDMSGPEPLVYLHGYNNIIGGLEKALEGRTPGDNFKITIPAAEAYGEWDESIMITVPRSNLSGVEKLEEGMELEAQFSNGSQIVKITKITDTEVTLDGNHPLAGMDLNFEINIKEIRDATKEEIARGDIHHEHEHCDGCKACGENKAGDGCNADAGCGTDTGCSGGCCHGH